HDRFYMDPRTIRFMLDDGTLYRVFRQSFDAHSIAFAERYLARSVDDELIKLPGVSSVDLDRFLSLIYPSELASCDLETPDEWISALRLAHRWSFPALRARAIQEIQLGGSAVDRVAAAREFSDLSSLQDWLLPSFMEACTTNCWLDAVSADDAERLGAGTVLQIARIREKVFSLTYGYVDVERAIVDAGLA
ncbi:hypothetical protein K525DRAFT_153276, partial [Schizophyllum commune Loenen D]